MRDYEFYRDELKRGTISDTDFRHYQEVHRGSCFGVLLEIMNRLAILDCLHNKGFWLGNEDYLWIQKIESVFRGGSEELKYLDRRAIKKPHRG